MTPNDWLIIGGAIVGIAYAVWPARAPSQLPKETRTCPPLRQ